MIMLPDTQVDELLMSDEGQPSFCLGNDALQPFDLSDEETDFFVDILNSGNVPASEVQLLIEQSLTASAEQWHALIDCARSLRRSHGINPTSLDGNDVLAFVSYILTDAVPALALNPWHETDRLIGLAKELQQQGQEIEILPSSRSTARTHRPTAKSGAASSSSPRIRGRDVTSHYWDDGPLTRDPSNGHDSSHVGDKQGHLGRSRICSQLHKCIYDSSSLWTHVRRGNSSGSRLEDERPDMEPMLSSTYFSNTIVNGRQKDVSPYFASPASTQKKSPAKRPPRGTISCVPFAPLDSPSFGLIQEKLAHEPFWLLVAITFLIRTKGTAAIPVFHAVRERFPTPADIADPANAEDILDMIRHLGLSANRLNLLQKYARLFMDNPPRAGRVYRVRNYDSRDMGPSPAEAEALRGGMEKPGGTGMLTPGEEDNEAGSWEIGHMTQGKYAIDSWRIFCRDELLGRAEDWNGKGSKPEFQPEWMRVRPDDKELRAYLRWMWMREGWEWDPVTGNRTVLRWEMLEAVNERRVEYDDSGGLRILDEPRATEHDDK